MPFHGHIVKLGFTNDIFLENNLIKMCSKCGVFGRYSEIARRNLSWTLIVSAAIQNGWFDTGLKIYVDIKVNRKVVGPNYDDSHSSCWTK